MEMIKSPDMTPEQRENVVNYLDCLEEEELTPDDIEVILDALVDVGLATKGEDGRWRLAKGVKVITDEEYHGG